MRALLIAWWVLLNLVQAAVIFGMFHMTRSPFETVVISALVLIYLLVLSSFTLLSHGLFQKGNQDLARFIVIAKALHIDTQIYEEAHKEDRQESDKGMVRFYINAFFRALFFIAAVANLLNAIVFR